MIIIAISLYLPEHITTMISRAWFYYAGEDAVTARGVVGRPTNGRVPIGNDGTKGKGFSSESAGQDVMNLLGAL